MAGPADPSDDVLLDCLLDGTESTALVIEMLAEDGFDIDSKDARAALERLAARALVSGEPAPHHQQPNATDTWWSLTPLGWLRYATEHRHPADADPLDGDNPPLQRALAHLLTQGAATDAELTAAVIKRNGRLPPDDNTVFRSLQDPSEWRRTLIAERITRALGRLATSGVIAGTPTEAATVRWHLTPRGSDAVNAR